jgi:hypothetical protein
VFIAAALEHPDEIRKILKSTAAILAPPTVRVLPTLLRSVATATRTAPKTEPATATR